MGSEKEIRRLEREVQRLEDLVSQEDRLARRASRNSTFVSLALGFVVFLFVAVNAVNIAIEFTEENVADSLEIEMQEIRPVAMRELGVLGKEVLPVYAREARNQLTKLRPFIMERFTDELDQLSVDLLTNVHRHLGEVQERVVTDTGKVLFDSYPSLASGPRRETVGRLLKGTTENAVAASIGDFDRRFGAHVKRVEETLWNFDLSDSNESPLDLQKKFIHLWLQLLDQEIMEL